MTTVPAPQVPAAEVEGAAGSPTSRAATLASQALDLVGSDPATAADLAQQVLGTSRTSLDPATRTTAWRALGLAARARGDLETAREALRRAVRSASAAGDRTSAAEARMTLSFVLLDLGHTGQALRQAARAAGDLDGVAGARMQAQRALILQRVGRFDEALDAYGDAVPLLRAHGDDQWESRACSNRGVLHAYRGELQAAELDLRRAYELGTRGGRDVDAAMTLWNLGCLARERGDVVLALERFDAADPVCDRYGVAVGQRLVDRATLLLSVGVVHEARRLAEAAHAALSEAAQAADLLECDALLARVALLDRDPDAAVAHARAARRAATRQGRPAWSLLARHLEVLALEQGGGTGRALASRALKVSEALEQAHWPEAAADSRLAAARIALGNGQRELAARLLSGSTVAVRHGSAALQVRHWHAVATAREHAGDRRGAASAVRAGFMVLSRHRAGIGATDLQAHVPAVGEDLARVGLRVALQQGSATKVLRELERWRGQDLGSRPVRPPRDAELSAAVEKVRRASSDLREASLAGSPVDPLRRALVAHEREVVRLSRRTRAGAWRPGAAPPRVDELREHLGDRVLVEYASVDGELFGITLAGAETSGRRRSPRLQALGSVAGVQQELAHLQFALARLATGRGSADALRTALAGANESARRLDRALMEPLGDDLAAREVVVVPTETLHAVPWSLLASTADRPVHLARSAAAWLSAREHRTARCSTDGSREVHVTGPGVTVAPGRRQALVPDVVVVDGAEATVARTLRELDGASVAHLAAHGTFRADNPLLSSLHLADGPLTVYDLEGLERPPRLVVLAACHSAAAQVLPGNQLLGVAHALLTLGSAGVVATTLPAPDAETATLMDALHSHLAPGSTPVLEFGSSLHEARRSLDLTTAPGFATSAGFDVYGC